MPRRCCIPGCKSNYDSTLKAGGQAVSTFSFPREETLRRAWIRAIPRANWTPTSGSFVCSEHFNNDEVIRTENVKNSNGIYDVFVLRNPKLLPGAVPHIFPKLCDDFKKKDLTQGFSDLTEPDEESDQYMEILCNNCQNVIAGFRYKCITCEDYNLCKKCEMTEVHSEHYVLRIPKPLKCEDTLEIAHILQQIFKPDEDTPRIKEEDPTSDNEPIQSCNVDENINLWDQSKKILFKMSPGVNECKDSEEPPVTVRRKRIRSPERAAVRVHTAPEIAFANVNSGFDMQHSSVDKQQKITEGRDQPSLLLPRQKLFETDKCGKHDNSCGDCAIVAENMDSRDKRNELFGQLLVMELNCLKPCLRCRTYAKILNCVNEAKVFNSCEGIAEILK